MWVMTCSLIIAIVAMSFSPCFGSFILALSFSLLVSLYYEDLELHCSVIVMLMFVNTLLVNLNQREKSVDGKIIKFYYEKVIYLEYII